MDDREWLRHVTLAEAAPDYSTVTDWVRRQNGFSLKLLWPECRLTTLKPMLKVAREATVFGYRKDGRYAHLCTDILIPDRGKFHLDLRKELFAGRDELWGCGFSGWSSLVVTVRNSESLLHPIISTGFGPDFVTNWRGGYGRAALAKARAVCQSTSHVAFCLQGIEEMQLVAHPDVAIELLEYVAHHCKVRKPDRGY